MTNTTKQATAKAAPWGYYDMQQVKYLDKLTFTVYGEEFTRSAHVETNEYGGISDIWVSCNNERVHLNNGASVTAVNGTTLNEWRIQNDIRSNQCNCGAYLKPSETVCWNCGEPTPETIAYGQSVLREAIENSGFDPRPVVSTIAAEATEQLKTAPAPVTPPPAPKPQKLDPNSVIIDLIAHYQASGEYDKVNTLKNMLVRPAGQPVCGDIVADHKRVTPPPAPVYNPNKQQRQSQKAPAPAPLNSHTVIMPMYEKCNTTDPTHKNYVNPLMFWEYFEEIRIDAQAIAAAANCDIRVYFRNTWAWYQPVNCPDGLGRCEAFMNAIEAAGLPHGYQYPPKALEALTAYQRNAVMSTEHYQYSRKRGQIRRVFAC